MRIGQYVGTHRTKGPFLRTEKQSDQQGMKDPVLELQVPPPIVTISQAFNLITMSSLRWLSVRPHDGLSLLPTFKWVYFVSFDCSWYFSRSSSVHVRRCHFFFSSEFTTLLLRFYALDCESNMSATLLAFGGEYYFWRRFWLAETARVVEGARLLCLNLKKGEEIIVFFSLFTIDRYANRNPPLFIHQPG